MLSMYALGMHSRGNFLGSCWRQLASKSSLARIRAFLPVEPGSVFDVVPQKALDSLPSRWILFSDLHVRHETLPLCVKLLRRIEAEALERSAGVAFLGDFWHTGSTLSTRQLNIILAELASWDERVPMIMIPGNHDQAMRGNLDPLLHALTPLQLAMPDRCSVFSRVTKLGTSLWAPYGTTAEELRTACAAASEGGLTAVFCHADIVGAMMSQSRQATEGLSADDFPPPPVQVYSGHYHNPHLVPEPAAKGRSIRYVGSPYETSMSEAGQNKSLLVVDRTQGWRLIDSLPLAYGRRHHKLSHPTAAQLVELTQQLSEGDRVLLLADPEDDDLRRFSASQRKRGVSVEVRPPAIATTLAPATAADAAVDELEPEALFSRYAAAKGLSEPLVAAGQRLLAECQADAQFCAPDPIQLELEHLSLEGYGSFEERTEYELGKRGLVLLQGEHHDHHGSPLSLQMGLSLELGAEGGGIGGSNGAGKTTLAMAPLWALTGQTDARASGKPVEMRGVISERKPRAVVTLRGRVREAGGRTTQFEVTRTMGKRSHSLRFVLDGQLHEGSLTQVQEQVNLRLRANHLGAVAFFGQHLQGGILDKSDAALKSEMQALLPIEPWEAAAERARARAAAARDASSRTLTELNTLEREQERTRTDYTAALAESEAWEQDWREKVDIANARVAAAELEEQRLVEGARRRELEKEREMKQSQLALQSARQSLDEASAALAAQRDRLQSAMWEAGALHELAYRVAVARTTSNQIGAKYHSAKHALEAAQGEVQLHQQLRKGWHWPHRRSEVAAHLIRQKDTEHLRGVIKDVAASNGLDTTVHDVAVELQRQVTLLQAQAMASNERLHEALTSNHTTDSSASVGVCPSCGQPVSLEHLEERHSHLREADTQCQKKLEHAVGQLQTVCEASDALQLGDWQSKLVQLEERVRSAEQVVESSLDEWRIANQTEMEVELKSKEAEQSRQTQIGFEQRKLVKLEEAEREARATANHWEGLRDRFISSTVDEARQEKTTEITIKQRVERERRVLEEIRLQRNPHTLLVEDMQERQKRTSQRQAELRRERQAELDASDLMSKLAEHLGKRGVQNLIYQLAINQLEFSSTRYSSMLSGGRFQFQLTFDEKRGAIQKEARLQREDGTVTSRSISQLSGGEWRSYMVFDEVMQHMDAEGQTALARLLGSLEYDTAVIIAHTLASDELYGMFDSIDVVEKVGDSSRVRRGSEMQISR